MPTLWESLDLLKPAIPPNTGPGEIASDPKHVAWRELFALVRAQDTFKPQTKAEIIGAHNRMAEELRKMRAQLSDMENQIENWTEEAGIARAAELEARVAELEDVEKEKEEALDRIYDLEQADAPNARLDALAAYQEAVADLPRGMAAGRGAAAAFAVRMAYSQAEELPPKLG